MLKEKTAHFRLTCVTQRFTVKLTRISSRPRLCRLLQSYAVTLNPVFKYTFLKFSRFRDYVSKCKLTSEFGRDDFRALTVTVWLYDLLWLATVVLLSSLPRQAHEESTTIKHNYNQPCPCTLQISIFKFFKTKDGHYIVSVNSWFIQQRATARSE